MAAPRRDPYQTLGVSAGVSDAELRAAYRRLVLKHHPDHNNGSAESARRFEEVQEAYARVRELRASGTRTSQSPPRARTSQPPPRARARPRTSQPPPAQTFDPDVEARAAALERELTKARLAQERARQAAREAAREAARDAARAAAREAGGESPAQRPGRPSDEELGYIRTDDSFSKIIADARAELSEKLSEAHDHPVVKRVSDLIDEIDEIASKLTGERSRHRDP